MIYLLTLLWILAMIAYSFAGDYARSFPNHGNKTIPLVRWGSLILAMGLSLQLAVRYQDKVSANNMWIFVIVGFVVIILSKLLFRHIFIKK